MKTTFLASSSWPVPQVNDQVWGGVVTDVTKDPGLDISYIEVETSEPIADNTTLVVIEKTSKGLLCRNGDDYYIAVLTPSPEDAAKTE